MGLILDKDDTFQDSDNNTYHCICFSKNNKEKELVLNNCVEVQRFDLSRQSNPSQKSLYKNNKNRNIRNKYELLTYETFNVETQPTFSYRKQSLFEVFS